MAKHANWKKRPGSFDPLHAEHLFHGVGRWEVPALLPQPPDLAVPADIRPYAYRQKIRTRRPVLLHFHTDDYRFEALWNEARRSLRSVARPAIWAACSPDFSLWGRYPLAMQIWNTYRNRWLGRYWQEAGVTVIPSVNWSSVLSYNFCFDGIPPGQIVTLRTFASATPGERQNFVLGYRTMVERLQPRLILWFGHVPEDVESDGVEKIAFPVGHVSYRDRPATLREEEI